MNDTNTELAIGGYFALERGTGRGVAWLDDAVAYQSARSALRDVLQAAQPQTVWVPHYICGAVNDALRLIDAKVRRYPLPDSLGVPADLDIGASDLVICVDYFGICGAAINNALRRFGPERVIVDASQSLFFHHAPGSTSIYSPRKFLGVPDGGLVLGPRQLAPRQAAVEGGSIARSQHLLWRLAGLVEIGYVAFQAAEESLSSCEPQAMSKLTRALLRSVDMGGVASRRSRNYNYLGGLLREAGFKVPSLPLGAVPLCCPVPCENAARVRKGLASKRIFTPSYWPDAVMPADDRVAFRLRDQSVFLPCDQRYGDREMRRVARAMIEVMEVT